VCDVVLTSLKYLTYITMWCFDVRVVITGGAGFIGHNIALHLHHRGYTVTVLDSFERASPIGVERIKEAGLDVVRADARDAETVLKLAKRADYVVHAAAYVSVEESMVKPELYIENNVLSTLAVARACLEAGVPVIYLSSAAVYGNPVELPIKESHPTNPISPYGLSKLFSEQLLDFYSRYGLKSTVLRLFNVYGPGQTSSYAGVVAKFVASALKREKLVIYGSGLQTRDFIHVRDVARAVELAMEKQVYREKFNIASGKPVTIRELAEIVRRIACRECPVEYRPPRPGDIEHSYADISKAVRVLGFKPQIELEEGLRELVEFAKRYGSI